MSVDSEFDGNRLSASADGEHAIGAVGEAGDDDPYSDQAESDYTALYGDTVQDLTVDEVTVIWKQWTSE